MKKNKLDFSISFIYAITSINHLFSQSLINGPRWMINTKLSHNFDLIFVIQKGLNLIKWNWLKGTRGNSGFGFDLNNVSFYASKPPENSGFLVVGKTNKL